MINKNKACNHQNEILLMAHKVRNFGHCAWLTYYLKHCTSLGYVVGERKNISVSLHNYVMESVVKSE